MTLPLPVFVSCVFSLCNPLVYCTCFVRFTLHSSFQCMVCIEGVDLGKQIMTLCLIFGNRKSLLGH